MQSIAQKNVTKIFFGGGVMIRLCKWNVPLEYDQISCCNGMNGNDGESHQVQTRRTNLFLI